MLLESWVTALAQALGLDPAEVDVEAVLDLARDAARAVERPAAPVTTYLVGLATARGGGDPAAFAEASRIATALAEGWDGGQVSSR